MLRLTFCWKYVQIPHEQKALYSQSIESFQFLLLGPHWLIVEGIALFSVRFSEMRWWSARTIMPVLDCPRFCFSTLAGVVARSVLKYCQGERIHWVTVPTGILWIHFYRLWKPGLQLQIRPYRFWCHYAFVKSAVYARAVVFLFGVVEVQ